MQNLEFRPMGIGDILDVTLRLYRSRFKSFALIALVAYVPYSILLVALPGNMALQQQAMENNVYVATSDYEYETSDPQVPDLEQMLFHMIPTLLFFVIVWPITQGALVNNISAGYLGKDIGAWECYKKAAPRFPKLLWTQILGSVIVCLGLILFVVPGVIFSLWFLLIPVVVMLEGVGGVKGLGRSRELMSGNLGKGFLISLVAGLLVAVIQWGVSYVVFMVPWPHTSMPVFLLNIIAGILIPIQLAPITLLYYDLRIRKEAFDLQMLSASMGEFGEIESAQV